KNISAKRATRTSTAITLYRSRAPKELISDATLSSAPPVSSPASAKREGRGPIRGASAPQMSVIPTALIGALLASTAIICSGVAAASDAIPNFAPDDRTSWFPDRPMGDDFLPPASGPGPVL